MPALHQRPGRSVARRCVTTGSTLGHRPRCVRAVLETSLTFLFAAVVVAAVLRFTPVGERLRPPRPVRGVPIALLDTADEAPVASESTTFDEAFLFGGQPRAWWANAATKHGEGTPLGALIRERARANGLLVRERGGVVRVEIDPTLQPRIGGWRR